MMNKIFLPALLVLCLVSFVEANDFFPEQVQTFRTIERVRLVGCETGQCRQVVDYVQVPVQVQEVRAMPKVSRTRSRTVSWSSGVTRRASGGSVGNVNYIQPVQRNSGGSVGNARSYSRTRTSFKQRFVGRFNHGGRVVGVSGQSTFSHLVNDHGVPVARAMLMTPRARRALHSRLHNEETQGFYQSTVTVQNTGRRFPILSAVFFRR